MGKKIKKIDIYEKTHRILYSFGAIVKFVSFLCVKKEHVKIIKKGKLPKPPYLLLSNHASFMDIYVAMVATGIHRPYWVCAAEEFVDKNFVCRWSGVMPKRRYIADARSNQMMMDILTKRKKVLVMYPESIWSYAGITERFDHNVAKFAKHARVPIVFINCHGHYLRQPQWGDQKIRKVSPMYAEVKTLLTKKQIDNFSFEDIDEAITQAMQYDEEQYQLDNNIKIDYPKRAEGLENLLYKCPHCGKEYEMTSKDDILSCKACGVSYRLKEDGTLECLNNPAKFHRISEWYAYEKDCVKQEIDA
nr:1-acyl-sn-glycerol-3-phosphate acyltransferase [Bacilli bacterium]